MRLGSVEAIFEHTLKRCKGGLSAEGRCTSEMLLSTEHRGELVGVICNNLQRRQCRLVGGGCWRLCDLTFGARCDGAVIHMLMVS